MSNLTVSLTVKYLCFFTAPLIHLLGGGNTFEGSNEYNFLQWEVVRNDKGAGGGEIVAQSRTNAPTDSISNPL